MDKRIVIFDLEATCDEANKFSREIIEIGAVDNYGNEFDKFVKPIEHPILTEFCKKLTTIKQSDINQANKFSDVFESFLEFLNLEQDDELILFSWGAYDKTQLFSDLELNDMSEDKVIINKHHQNLKEYFHDKMGYWPKGMKRVLKELKLPLDGTHHRGIDDSRNLMKIYNKINEE